MSHGTPEERELGKKRAELVELETELAQRELDLATLAAELRAFEVRYLRAIGVLFAELDELTAQLAESQALDHPQDAQQQHAAADARAEASASAEALGDVDQQRPMAAFVPSTDLKRLYREVAKLVHPDLATDSAERARRDRVMAGANRAYGNGDEARLRAILDEWVSSPEAVPGEGIAAELVRTIRKIHQIQQRLANIEGETSTLKRSDSFVLFKRVEESRASGRDLLDQMATELRRRIAAIHAALNGRRSGEVTA